MTAPVPSLESFRRQLLADGVISRLDAEFTPLTGGVSSDIYRLEDAGQVTVVKRALPQLRVDATWFADIGRNRYEVAYLNRVRQITPGNVPQVFFHNAEQGYFTMEHLGPEFRNWKTMLLAGHCEIGKARAAGAWLGRIHQATWDDTELRAEFDTTDNFHDLRLEPYLLATAERHPELRPALETEVERIHNSRQCLVHGDFSPKNLLFKDDRMIVLDCEVAWFGDAAFDLAFLLNHLAIKALHLPDQRDRCLEMVRAAWDSYRTAVGHIQVEPVLARLLPMLMLARVDGKSPLEYLGPDARTAVREFATEAVPHPTENLIDLLDRWQVFLSAHENR
jgi:aminoglycoside phosphotransferase (APT) family kinase protein